MTQIERIIKILVEFSNNRKFTTRELCEFFENRFSIRTIQRDIVTLERAGIPLKHEKDIDGDYVWYFPSAYRKMVLPSIQPNELLAAYILKSYLRTFKGTRVEKDVTSLIDKMGTIVPGDIYIEYDSTTAEQSLLWDQDYGEFDYHDYDEILMKVISLIVNKEWAVVDYKKPENEEKKIDIFIHRLFNYNGVLYLAVSTEDYKEYISLALHRIKQIEKSKKQNISPIDFDINKFRESRFGVYSGEVEHVKLLIDKEVVFYFTNRQWHPSQKISLEKDDSMLLEMDVPITYELIGWILSWRDNIKVLSSNSLIDQIKANLNSTMKLYD